MVTPSAPSTIEELEAGLAALLPNLGQIISDAATGEGGIAKVTKVFSDLNTVLQTFEQEMAAVQQAPPAS